MSKMITLKAMRWFDTVRDSCDDLDNSADCTKLVNAVAEAADYYLSVNADAEKHILVAGKLETMLTEITGLAFFYGGIHTDSQQVRKYLELLLENYEAKKYVWFQTDPSAKSEYGKLTATDLRNFVDADDIVCMLKDCVRLIANRQHVLENIQTQLTAKGFNLKTITDLRINNMEEVWIDGTKETKNR
jgi:hypothetical protein